jgi:ribosomal protein S18 acetylase RimI-like enzyme
VEAVTDAAQMEDFLRAYVAGWRFPERDHERFKANVRPWLRLPGWSLYLARVDGRPAAAAMSFLHGDVAYLADACTDPAFRRRGLHAALLRRRIADARQAGADLIFSGAEFLSGSYRDMQRVGMQLVFLRAIWSPLAPA